MKTNWKKEWPHWLMLAAMFCLAAWRWSESGDKIPVHWGLNGQVDRYGGKFEGLLVMPLISLALYGFLLFVPRLDPGRANYTQFGKAFDAIRLSVSGLNFVLYGAMIAASVGHKIQIAQVILPATGAMFIVMGNAMGKLRPNWFVGIRTPWTLSSKVAWIKTHRVGGWAFIAVGALQIVMGLTLPPAPALITTMTFAFGVALGLSAYSFFVWRNADDKTPPAGTLPAEDFA